MRGVFFAIVFCAFSLILAKGLTTILVTLGFIHSHEADTAFGTFMLTLLIGYLFLGPRTKEDDE